MQDKEIRDTAYLEEELQLLISKDTLKNAPAKYKDTIIINTQITICFIFWKYKVKGCYNLKLIFLTVCLVFSC